MKVGLKIGKGLVRADSLEEVEQCPIEPDVPFGISECGLQLHSDVDKKQALQASRERWLAGGEKEALKFLRDVLKES